MLLPEFGQKLAHFLWGVEHDTDVGDRQVIHSGWSIADQIVEIPNELNLPDHVLKITVGWMLSS